MSTIAIGDRVEIRAGDERGGWGIVRDVPATAPDGRYHVGLYDSRSDVRVYDRNELVRPRVRRNV